MSRSQQSPQWSLPGVLGAASLDTGAGAAARRPITLRWLEMVDASRGY